MVKTLLIPALIGVIVPTQAKILKAKEVATNSYTASSFIGDSNETDTRSTFVSSGIQHSVLGDDEAGKDTDGKSTAWKYASYVPYINNDNVSTDNIAKSFSLKNNDEISFTFSVDMYNSSNGNTNYTTVNNDGTIHVWAGTKDNSEILDLKIFAHEWGVTNGNHSYKTELKASSWANCGSQDNTSVCIKGNATADSFFTVYFSKENLFSTINQYSEKKCLMYSGDDTTLTSNVASAKAAFSNVDDVVFKINGDNGWSKTANVVLKSINGQSLANTDGQFTDNVAPTFDAFSMPSSLQINQSTTLNITAHDVLSSDISYFIEYNGKRTEGLTFTPTIYGQDSVKVYATDASGNEASKEFTFTGTGDIAAPSFNDTLPTIESKTYDYFDTVTVAKPDVTDNTGVGTVTMKYRKKAAEATENTDATEEADTAEGTEETDMTGWTSVSLNEVSNNFSFIIDEDFEAGDYEYCFDATNSKGTTTSEIQTVNIEIKEYKPVDFVNKGDAKAIIEYENTGIKIRTRELHKDISLGSFLLDDGIKVTYHIPFKNTQGLTNGPLVANSYVDLKLTNVKDSSYNIIYRVWTANNSDNKDNPTNVLVNTPTGSQNIENAGWILYGNNENYKELNLNFSMDEYFSSLDHSGNKKIAEVDGKTTISDAITAFFDTAPKSRYNLTYCMGNVGASLSKVGSIADTAYEGIVTKINDQDLANTDGAITDYKDMTVKLSGENTAERGKEMTYGAYFKDIFNDNVTKSVKIVKPDNTEEDVTSSLADDEFKYTFSALGKYKIVASATGTNSKTVTEELEVTVTQERIPTSITLKGEYVTTANVGDKITILGADYTSNVNPEKCTITVIDGSNKETAVNVGDEYTLAKAGVYTIRYFASDDATPEPNTATLDVVINVPDTEKPVVNFVTEASYEKGSTVNFKVEATDDTELTYAISVSKPDNTVSKFTTPEFALTLDQEGKWTIKVKVTDLYDNETVLTKEFEVKAKQEGGETSSVPTSEDSSETSSIPTPASSETPSSSDSSTDTTTPNNTGVIVGSVVGGVGGLSVIGAIVAIIIKKRKLK